MPGAKGDDGQKGESGEAGIPGDDGAPGRDGERGPKGDDGLKGEPGARGDRGPLPDNATISELIAVLQPSSAGSNAQVGVINYALFNKRGIADVKPLEATDRETDRVTVSLQRACTT